MGINAQETPPDPISSPPSPTEPEQPDMAYQPPADADELSDFLPPAGEIIAAPPAEPITPTLPVTPTLPFTPTIPITSSTSVTVTEPITKLVSFEEGKVAVVFEEGTLTETAEIQLTLLPLPQDPLTATNTLSNPVDSLVLQKFQIEVAQDGEIVSDEFAKPVRLIVDLRSLMGQLDASYQTWTYYLAYQHENDPDIWIEVPLDVYQPDGLLSAEVTHFSNWAAGVRPDRGFTGHLHNNLGNAPDDIGLVYMQARWHLPGLARFISADTIIPNPANPQSYNRYSYVLNRALNFTDPTGHRPSDGCDDYEGCSAPAENLWQDTDGQYYSYDPKLARKFRDGADYTTAEISVGSPLPPVGGNISVTKDRYDNWYFGVGVNVGKSPLILGGRVVLGEMDDDGFWPLTNNVPDEDILEMHLTGLGENLGGGFIVGGGITAPLDYDERRDVLKEGGLYTPQIGLSVSYNLLIYDNNSDTPWIWQKWIATIIEFGE
ncbi:MAG: hypothetical protein KF770_19090 [Anaerolineae bacterium]|nr:hypothetical protein [Anaerolineae bacterium]